MCPNLLPILPNKVYSSQMIKHQPVAKSTDSPRHAAFETLQRLSGSDLHADDLIDHELSQGSLVGADRGLYCELVLGALRRQGTLDHYLSLLADQPIERLQLPVILLLRLGLYQLLYLDRVPDHAAVHESVELSKKIIPKASGLINGVLRNFIRKREGLAMPDPVSATSAWISAAHSVPQWLAEQWLEQFSAEEAAAIAAASSEFPPLTLRANTLKVGRDELMALFASEGIAAEPCSFSPEGIRLLERHFIRDLPGFDIGLFVVQDEASQIASHLLAPKPGELVLDACAAPGGKATHLAQLMSDRGEVAATDLNQRKVRKIRESAERLGLSILKPQAVDVMTPAYQQGREFDRILLDAPCSGLGVIRRNPDAKWRLKPEQFARFAERQRNLLFKVAPLLRKGGILLYATCSTAAEENELLIEDFLSRNPEFVLENMSQLFPHWSMLFSAAGNLRLWPHIHKTDGFFAARLRRIDR